MSIIEKDFAASARMEAPEEAAERAAELWLEDLLSKGEAASSAGAVPAAHLSAVDR